MKRIIITCILILTAGLCLAPVLFLLVGTFMGNHEIYTCIAPALGKGDGPAIWHLLPQYPTLQNVVGLLFDSPEYFQMFWNSIFYTGAILAGQMLFGMPEAWGLSLQKLNCYASTSCRSYNFRYSPFWARSS